MFNPHKIPARLLLLPALCLLGCAWGDEPEPDTLPDYQVGEEEALDFDGYFISKMVFAQCVEDPFGGGMTFQNITSYSVNRVEYDEEASGVWVGSDLCVANMTEVFGTAMALGDGFPPAVSQEGPYLFKLTSNKVGAMISLDEVVELRGVDLDDPYDPLPTDLEDPRIYDFDDDGNPGFTVHLDGAVDGDLWGVERMVLAIEGQIFSQDLIAGDVIGHLQDSFIYSSKRVIPTDSLIVPIDEPGMNYFELRRVDHDIQCAELSQEFERYFEEDAARRAKVAESYCDNL